MNLDQARSYVAKRRSELKATGMTTDQITWKIEDELWLNHGYIVNSHRGKAFEVTRDED